MPRKPVNLPRNKAIRRILVIKWSAMGDVVIASALFEDIARAFPGREIHLNTLPSWKVLFKDDTRFQHIFAIDLRNKQHPLRGILEWLRYVRNMHYDLVIDLQSNDRSRLLLCLLWLSGGYIPYRIGNNPQFPYNITPGQLPNPVHTIIRTRAALQAGGIPTLTQRPVLHIPPRNRERARQIMESHALRPNQYAIFFPGCNPEGHLKRWGAARYSALAEQLHGADLDKIVLIGGKDELDECLKIEQSCGPWLVNLCGQTEIFDIIPLCEGARLLVANDTGTAHLASATDRPMTVICGPTDPRRVKPLGDNVTTLQADLPCINCYRKECSHHSCMPMITPVMVFKHVQQVAQTELREKPAGSEEAWGKGGASSGNK